MRRRGYTCEISFRRKIIRILRFHQMLPKLAKIFVRTNTRRKRTDDWKPITDLFELVSHPPKDYHRMDASRSSNRVHFEGHRNRSVIDGAGSNFDWQCLDVRFMGGYDVKGARHPSKGEIISWIRDWRAIWRRRNARHRGSSRKCLLEVWRSDFREVGYRAYRNSEATCPL